MSLNDDALAMFELCDGTPSVADIKIDLADDYEGDELRPRIVEFIEFGIARGLLLKEP